LVDPASPEAIAEGIHRVLTDASLRERQIAAGFRRAAQFDWEITNRQLAGLIATLLDSPPPRRGPRAVVDLTVGSLTRVAASIIGLLGGMLAI
jgi:hypothetical protein